VEIVERIGAGRHAGSVVDVVALAGNSLIDDKTVDLAANNYYEGGFS
jgi:hypothetical protein